MLKRILGFTANMYGDLMMNAVAARCLKRVVPDCHLTFVIAAGFRECAPLFADHPDIDRVHILHKPRDGFDEVDLAWIRAQNFAHICDPMADHRDRWWEHRHQSLEAANVHGLPTEGDDGQIRLTKWFTPDNRFKDHVAFNPWPSFHEGTSNPKAIPPAMAQEIVDWIRDHGLHVLQVGGPTEPQLTGTTKIDTDYFASVRNVLGCRAMVMGDSGLNWCLSGYQFPVLGLYSERYFGREFIHNIQPRNPNGVYLTGKTVGEIPFEEVADRLRSMVLS